jgi:hypothetical protein
MSTELIMLCYYSMMLCEEEQDAGYQQSCTSPKLLCGGKITGSGLLKKRSFSLRTAPTYMGVRYPPVMPVKAGIPAFLLDSRQKHAG